MNFLDGCFVGFEVVGTQHRVVVTGMYPWDWKVLDVPMIEQLMTLADDPE